MGCLSQLPHGHRSEVTAPLSWWGQARGETQWGFCLSSRQEDIVTRSLASLYTALPSTESLDGWGSWMGRSVRLLYGAAGLTYKCG